MYLNDLTVYYQLTDDEDVLFLLKNVEQLDNKAIQHDFIAKFLQVAEKYKQKSLMDKYYPIYMKYAQNVQR